MVNKLADPLKLIDINGLNNDLEKEFDLNLDNFIGNDVGFDEFPVSYFLKIVKILSYFK